MEIYNRCSQNTRGKWWKKGKKCRRDVPGRWVWENVCIIAINSLVPQSMEYYLRQILLIIFTQYTDRTCYS